MHIIIKCLVRDRVLVPRCHKKKISIQTKSFLSKAILLCAERVLLLAILPQEYNEQRKTDKFIPYAFGVVLTAVSDLRWLEPELTI